MGRWNEVVRVGSVVVLAGLLMGGAALAADDSVVAKATVQDLGLKYPALATVAQLKTQKPAETPTLVKPHGAAQKPLLRADVSAVKEAAKSVAYARKSGVVLDAAHLVDDVTGSKLTLNGITWEPVTEARVKAGMANVPVLQAVRWDDSQGSAIGPGGYLACFGQAEFFHLPPDEHTYMLSVGTSSKPQALHFRVNGAWLYDPGTAPKPYDARVYFKVDGSTQDTVKVELFGAVASKLTNASQVFLHVQLAQVD